MATQVQWRGGSTAEHATFTGAAREVTVDTQKKTLVVHDGSTAGGEPLLREDQANLPSSVTNGIYSPSANNVAISTNGTGRVFVDANGNVGIATSTPSTIATKILHIAAGAGDSAGLRVTGNNGTGFDFIQAINGDAFIYNRENNPIALGTNNTERLRITSDGKLGLGTSSPSGLFDAAGTLGTVRIQGSGSNLEFTRNGGNTILASGADGEFYFQTGGTNTRMFISKTGNVGIGTTGPLYKLDCLVSSGSQNIFRAGQSGVSNGYVITTDGTDLSHIWSVDGGESARIDSSGRLLVGTSSDSQTSTLVLQGNSGASNDASVLRLCRGANNPSLDAVLGYLTWGDSGHTPSAWIAGVRDTGTWTSGSSQPTRLTFSTTPDGLSSPTERMRISNDGNILIATNSFPGGTSEGFGFQAASKYFYFSRSDGGVAFFNRYTSEGDVIYLKYADATVGSISVTASATAYNTSSDYRLKENVVPLTGAADRVNQLQVHRFNFIADPDTTVDGFIAHEAQAVVPECVTGAKDEVDEDGTPVYQGIDQSKIVPLLTAALQEALAKIEVLEQRLSDAGIA